MKQSLISLLVMLSLAHAQTPQWSFSISAPAGYDQPFVKHSVFDGIGGSAWNLQFDGSGLGRVSALVWLDAKGRTVYTNTFAAPPFSRTTLRLARFTKTELTAQVQIEDDGGVSTNYVLRIRKSGAGVIASQFPIGSAESVSGSVGAPSDVRGTFTSETVAQGIIIHRY